MVPSLPPVPWSPPVFVLILSFCVMTADISQPQPCPRRQYSHTAHQRGEERYFRLDSGYLYFLELVDTQVIIIATQTQYFDTPQWIHSFCFWNKHESSIKTSTALAPANNVASFKDILILDHDLNSNDGTASNNHHPHNGSNLNSAPFVIIKHTRDCQNKPSSFSVETQYWLSLILFFWCPSVQWSFSLLAIVHWRWVGPEGCWYQYYYGITTLCISTKLRQSF